MLPSSLTLMTGMTVRMVSSWSDAVISSLSLSRTKRKFSSIGRAVLAGIALETSRVPLRSSALETLNSISKINFVFTKIGIFPNNFGILFDFLICRKNLNMSDMKKSLLTILICVILSGLTAFCVAKVEESRSGQLSGAKTLYNADGLPVKTVNLSLSDYPDFTYAAENAVNAVVYVKVTVKSQFQSIDDPFFQFFFGNPGNGGREGLQQGSGSGVIIRPDGYIVTNNHVVANATSVEVTLNNNKTYKAKVIGTDAATDVALIKIDASGLPTITFADSDKLRLGEWVLAIGSPLGAELRSTITAGIVSAKGRSLPNYDGKFKIESFIQTDAAVNPGNSGGALVNKAGELVGINTAIISQTGAYTGDSLAVAVNIG